MCETNTILMRRGGGYMCETNTILMRRGGGYMCETNTILMRRGGGYMCETNTILISISMRCSSASRAYTAADTAADTAASQDSLNLFSEKPGVSHRKPSTIVQIGPAV
jgi:hypothetical protein